MELIGEKVKIRDTLTPDEITKEAVWSSDVEMQRLDPPISIDPNAKYCSIYTHDNKHIGTLCFYNINKVNSECEFGIRIGDKDYWNQGYGTDAVKIIMDYLFNTININRVWLKVLRSNTRAIVCYTKCGFEVSGRVLLSGYDFIIMEIKRS